MTGRNQRWIVTVNLTLLGLLSSACGVRQPGSLERSVVTLLKQRITVGGKQESNPFPSTPDNIAEGRKAFSYYCVTCHGLDGQATGVPFAERMSPPIPSLASSEVQSYRDGQLKWIVDNGIFPSGMPASKGILNDEEIWKIIQYIRHLPAKGSLGEPAVYGGETGGNAVATPVANRRTPPPGDRLDRLR